MLLSFLDYFFVRKSVFYACFLLIGSWKVGKKIRVGIFLSKQALGKGYRKQTTIFKPYLVCRSLRDAASQCRRPSHSGLLGLT